MWVRGEFRLFLYVHVPHVSLEEEDKERAELVVLEDAAQSENVSLNNLTSHGYLLLL